MMTGFDYRRFEEIPVGETFADKFGRVSTKTGSGSATEHGYWDDAGIFQWEFDESRDYFDADAEELDDCDMWAAWPYYRVAAEAEQLSDKAPAEHDDVVVGK